MGLGTLADLKQLLPAMFDDSTDAVVVVGLADEVVYVNPPFLALAKLTRAQIADETFTDVCALSSALSDYPHTIKDVVETKAAVSISRRVDMVGSRQSSMTASPLLSTQQSVLGVMLITKLRALADKVLDSHKAQRMREAYQNAMVNTFSFLVWVKDKEGRFLVANNAVAALVGAADPKSLEGKTDHDLFPAALAAGYVEGDQRVLDSGEPVILVEQVQKVDGSMQWIETYKAPVVLDGEVLGTVGYANDITEQKALLSTISQKELEYDALVNNIPLAIVRYDINARRVFVNLPKHDAKSDAVQVLLGKTPLELWDTSVQNMTAEEYQDKLMQVLLYGKTQTFELHAEVEGVHYVHMVNMLPEYDEHEQIVGALTLANDVTEISQYRYDLEHLAFHDALTSLPNRTLLDQRLRQAAEKGGRFGLLFMDLDFFKAINDTLGHSVGDGLLIDAAKRIANAVRADDVVARIGGDEFAILVGNLQNDADLGRLASNIAEQLSAPFDIEGANFFITASIGIACYPSDSEAVEDLMKFADMAMYDAKKQGRDSYQYYTPELAKHATRHLAIATALRYAVEKEELSLLCQPKVDIGTGEILGAEMLLRWHGQVLGEMEPDQFISIAEESGLIVDIGAWVLNASCEMAAQLNQHREKPLNIAVNVSPKEFVGNHYIAHLQDCLQKTGCQPAWLTLEITESLLLQDTGEALETLIKISEMGITLAIDDFGTGYSALAYLSKFPIRQVKIDRSFVTDICDHQTAASLVRAIIAMALSLDKELVAEGVETTAQAALIKQYGCDQAQGNLYSKPISFSDFMDLLQQKIH